MQSWEQQFDLEPGGLVVVEQNSGPVKIQAWDQPRVQVKAACQGGPVAERIQIRQQAQKLVIEVAAPRRGLFTWMSGESDSLFLQLMVPQRTACQVESGSGPVAVEGIMAPVQVETGSGAVRAHNVTGSLRIETGSGGVDMQDCRGQAAVEVGSGDVVVRRAVGALKLETGSGDVVIDRVEGDVTLETGSGAVTVSGVRGRLLSMETGGGKISAGELDLEILEVESGSGAIWVELVAVQPGGRYQVESGSGPVTVAVPPEADLRVDLQSPAGRVDYQNLNLREVRLEQGELRGVLNRGTARLSVEAANGRIALVPSLRGRAEAGAAPGAEAEAEPEPLGGPQPAERASAAGGDQFAAVTDADPALADSDQLRRVLRLVQEGKLTPAQAEEILRTLDEEDPV